MDNQKQNQYKRGYDNPGQYIQPRQSHYLEGPGNYGEFYQQKQLNRPGQNYYQQGPPAGGQNFSGQQSFNPGQTGTAQYTVQGSQTTSSQQTKVKNPSSNIVPETKSPQMNDRDYLNDILATEKYLTDNFNIFTREASHQQLFNDLKQILNETHDCTRNAFNLMFKNGFYALKPAGQQELQKEHQKFAGYFNTQAPYNQSMY